MTIAAVAAAIVLGPVAPRVAAAAPPGQVITVEALGPRSVHAVVRTWQLGAHGYRQVFAPMVAFIGVNGMGPTREGWGRTPVGVYRLTQAFGNRANPGTRVPYRRVGVDDWWDENPASARYNRMVASTSSPGGDSENLYDAGEAYAAAVVIDYNMDPVVAGRGSGFFLHVSMGAPTEGCVAIAHGSLVRVMRWLNPARDPEIAMGVGRSALGVVADRAP